MDQALVAKYDRQVPRYTSYPTAPHFHAGVEAATYRRWLEAVPDEAGLSLYVHIPFCDSLCWFCGCYTKVVRRYGPIGIYLQALHREIEMVAEAMGSRGQVRHVQWGGGTPTILTPDDVEGLAGKLREHFSFADDAEFAVEIDPRALTRETVAALGRAGMTRASIGVQDVNPEVQRAINRWQPLDETREVVDWLRAEGIDAINVDLMYGLPHQTPERMAATVDAAIELAPARLALFGYAHVPWMKRHQQLIDETALPDGDARLAEVEVATERLGRGGYVPIGLDHFARADDTLAVAQREHRLHRNFQGYTTDAAQALIGFGASAIGSLPDGYVQNTVPINEYRSAVLAGSLATVRGVAIDDEDRLRRAVIERLMCELEADLGALGQSYGRGAGHFGPELERLEALSGDGLVVVDDDRIRVPEDARALLRVVCAVFDQYLETGKGRHSRAV